MSQQIKGGFVVKSKNNIQNTTMGLITKIMSLAGAVFLSLTLTNCAQKKSSTNSLEQYKQIRKTLGPVHDEKPINQNYIQTDLYSINPQGIPKVVFEVGKRNVLRINTALRLPGTSYELISHDKPDGSELKNVGDGIWELAWTPSPNLMSVFKTGTVRNFHVSIRVIDSTDLRAKEIIKNLAAESTIEYSLEFPKAAPEILSIAGIAPFPEVTKLNEGDVVALKIQIKDESSSTTQKPTLINPVEIDKLQGKESVISGSRFFILLSDATLVKPGIWEITAQLNTKDIAVPAIQQDFNKPALEKVISNLNLQVQGANGKISTQKIVSFEITYRQTLLRPVFETKNPELELKNQTDKVSFSFESYLPSAVGSMTTYLSDETVKIPGTPKLSCKVTKKIPFHQTCTLTWTIPCAQTPGDVSLKIISAGEHNGQNSSVEFIKKITVAEHRKCVPVVKEPKKGDKK